MRAGKPAPAKGLKRAERKPKNIAAALKHLKERNNRSTESTNINLLLFTAVSRLQNVRFRDLQINEFKAPSDRNSKNYALLVISLFISGTAARSRVITSFGLSHGPAARMLQRMQDAGYIEPVDVKVLKTWKGHHFMKAQPHLQLTSKGYDLGNLIADLITDTRII